MAIDTMPIADIKVRDGYNVRRNGGGIDELAESIKLLGVTTPVTVNGKGELVAGFRRVAAAQLAGVTEIPYVLEDGDEKREIAVHAVENIARQQLSPADEATAIERMIEKGFTLDGAAQALGLTKAKVTRRAALLELPVDLRDLWGPGGTVNIDVAQHVAAIVSKVPKLAPVILHAERTRNEPRKEGPGQEELEAARDQAYEDGMDYWEDEPEEPVRLPALDMLSTDPRQYMLGLHNAYDVEKPARGVPKWPAGVTIFVAGAAIDAGHLDGLKIPETLAHKHNELYEKVRFAPYYEYNLRLELIEQDMDAARAAGVTIALGEWEFVFDPKWLRERIKSDVLPRFEQSANAAMEQHDKRIAERMKNTGQADGSGAELSFGEQRAQDSKDAARRTREKEKEWKPRAAAVNEELGAALLNKFSTVTVDAKIAKIFAEASLGGRPPANAGFGDMPSHRTAAKLASAGLRYVMPGWQTVVPTPTKANPGKTKTEFLELVDAEAKLWEWFDKAKTPEEIFGRALIIHAAAAWANEHVLPMSSRSPLGNQWWVSLRSELPRDVAERMLKLVEPKIPASVKKLAKEIKEFDAKKEG